MLITSQSMHPKGALMSDQIAKADIVEKNAAGQYVVVVPKGQPIPKDLVREAKPVAAPAENKARRAPRKN